MNLQAWSTAKHHSDFVTDPATKLILQILLHEVLQQAETIERLEAELAALRRAEEYRE